MTPTPDFREINRPQHLWAGRADTSQGVFYRITPVKGARIEGIIGVGMASREVRYGPSGNRVTVDAPVMWVDLSPIIADKHGHAGSEREPLSVNGKTYDARFGARVEFYPTVANDYRLGHWPVITLSGYPRFVVSVSFDPYDAFTDAARNVVNNLLIHIAREYVTSRRWHHQQINDAEHNLDRARNKLRDAQTEFNTAQIELQKITGEQK